MLFNLCFSEMAHHMPDLMACGQFLSLRRLKSISVPRETKEDSGDLSL